VQPPGAAGTGPPGLPATPGPDRKTDGVAMGGGRRRGVRGPTMKTTRPTKFATVKDGPIVLVTYERIKP